MPTASVTELQIRGKTWFRKRNPDTMLNDIEFRIYRALRRSFDYIPRVVQESPTTLLVEGAGTTFADVMNSPAHERLASLDILYRTIKARCDVNRVVNRVLTDEDKAYLTQIQREKLLASVRKRNPKVDGDELVNNYWAYRMMNALGIHNEKFKEAYTETIGARIDSLMEKFGSWRTDNYTRNNVVTADGIVIPFDFNSVRYGLSQMDTATIAAHYVLAGPLAIATEGEQRESALKKLAELEGYDPDDPDYVKAFFVGSIHANGLIAGYRTRECRERRDKIVSAYKRGITSEQEAQAILDEYLALRYAFEDIDYYQSVVAIPINRHLNLVAGRDEIDNLRRIEEGITHNSFGQRMLILMSMPDEVQSAGNDYANRMVANIQ